MLGLAGVCDGELGDFLVLFLVLICCCVHSRSIQPVEEGGRERCLVPP